MRTKLRQRLHTRSRYTATFQRHGWRPGPHVPIATCCFECVTDSDGEIVAGHLWLDAGAGFDALDLQPGDVVSFEARVKRYPKGYKGGVNEFVSRADYDYCLSGAVDVRRVGRRWVLQRNIALRLRSLINQWVTPSMGNPIGLRR